MPGRPPPGQTALSLEPPHGARQPDPKPQAARRPHLGQVLRKTVASVIPVRGGLGGGGPNGHTEGKSQGRPSAPCTMVQRFFVADVSICEQRGLAETEPRLTWNHRSCHMNRLCSA